MSLFDSLGSGNQQQSQAPNVKAQQAMEQLRSNPAGVLGQIGLNIPSGMTDPQQMVQHLVQSGQVPQGRLAQAMQMMGQMMGRR